MIPTQLAAACRRSLSHPCLSLAERRPIRGQAPTRLPACVSGVVDRKLELCPSLVTRSSQHPLLETSGLIRLIVVSFIPHHILAGRLVGVPERTLLFCLT